LGDILHPLRAEINETDVEVRADVIPNSTRDANSIRLRKSF
jgi:hypothetical protein